MTDTQPESIPSQNTVRRRRGRKGAELYEFTMVFFPLLLMLFCFLSIGWAIFCKSTILWATRMAVRKGVVATSNDVEAAGATGLSSYVRKLVRENSMGLVPNDSYVKVSYYKLGDSFADPLIEATGDANANRSYNLLVVEIDNVPFSYLLPFFTSDQPNRNSTTGEGGWKIYASAADRIEPNNSLPSRD